PGVRAAVGGVHQGRAVAPAAAGAVEHLHDMQRHLPGADTDHAAAVVGRGDGAGDMGAVAAAVVVPAGRIAGHRDAGEFRVAGVDARVDHADLDAAAVRTGGDRVGRLHAVDAV